MRPAGNHSPDPKCLDDNVIRSAQQRTVGEVEPRLSVIEELAAGIALNLIRANRMHSILLSVALTTHNGLAVA